MQTLKLIIIFALFFLWLKRLFSKNPMKTKEQIRKEYLESHKEPVDTLKMYQTSQEQIRLPILYQNDIYEWLDDVMKSQEKEEYNSYLLNDVYERYDGDIVPIYKAFYIEARCDGENVDVLCNGEWKHLGKVVKNEQLNWYLLREPKIMVDVSGRFGKECLQASAERVKLGKEVIEYDYTLLLCVNPTKTLDFERNLAEISEN